MKIVYEPAKELHVAAESDVVVVGGGPGGIVAALAAARTGAQTLLIERYGYLGGMATAGLMTGFNGFRNERPPNHLQTVRGIAQEIVDRLIAAGGADGCTAHGNYGNLTPGECPYAISIDPEVFKRVALEMLDESGVDLLLHTTFTDAIRDGQSIAAIIVESKSGRQAIQGQIFVDATGDGDVAARAGASYEKVDRVGQHMMSMTLMYRVCGIPKPGPDERRLWCNGLTTRWGPYISQVDGSSVADLTSAEICARQQLAQHLARLRAEFPEVQLVDTAATIGVRETRRIHGLYTITEEDALTGQPQPDAIAISSNPIPNYYGQRRFLPHLGFEIPYRSLVPVSLDNVLLAGRCISASQPAFQSARSMAPAMAISQASGTAAAMCVARGCCPAALDVAELQARLERDGAVIRVPPEERERAAGLMGQG